LRIGFLTSIVHPQIKYEAEYLSKRFHVTYMVTPILERKQLLYAFKCLFKNFPEVCTSLLKLKVPPIPQLLPNILISSIILEKGKMHTKKYDLIYAHWLYPAGFIGLMLSKILNCKLILAIWGYDI